LEDTNTYIQKLNDMYTNPSGSESGHPETEPAAEKQKQAPDSSGNPKEEPIESAAPKDATEPQLLVNK
jgi:hypothetical protein